MVCLYCLGKPVRYMYAIMLGASVFQAAPVFQIGDGPVPLFFMTEIFFIIRVLRSRMTLEYANTRVIRVFAIFVFYAMALTCIAPFLFSGMPVISGSIDDYDLVEGIVNGRLSFSFSNIIQITYITVFLVTAYCIVLSFRKISWTFTMRVIHYIILFVVCFGILDLLLKGTSIGRLSDFIFHSWSNYVYSGADRLNSTFNEASYAGAFLSMAFWLLFFLGKIKSSLFVFIALVLNMSGTGLVAFLFGGIIFVVFRPKYIGELFWGSLLIVLCIYSLDLYDKIYDMLFNKSESISGLARGAAMLHSLSIIKDTYFIGVGLGSHRCMSFLTGLFASLGLIGGILFLRIFITLYRLLWSSGIKEFRAWSFSGVILMFACFLSIPDMSFPIIWMWVFVSILGCCKVYSLIHEKV